MSFSPKLAEAFGKVVERSPFTALDPIVKINHVSKGNNVIFGRAKAEENPAEVVYIGKVLENAAGRSYLGADAWLDVTFPHVVYITGTRGSGKSFDLGVLIEGISQLESDSPVQNKVTPITSILIDTQSQFWTLRYEPRLSVPENRQQLGELKRWNIKPNALKNCRIFIPPNTEPFLGDEIKFSLQPRYVTAEDWCSLLGQEIYGPQGHIISETCEALEPDNYSLDDMIAHIADASNWPGIAESSRNALVYKLTDYRRTGLFSANGLDVGSLLTPGVANIFMLRDLRNEDKSLVTAIIARQLFLIMGRHHKDLKVAHFFEKEFKGADLPTRVWLLIDEAHVVAPSNGPSPAREALVEYVKRGRDAGLSLVLATQQPSAVDDRILSQVNISFNHRLTFQSDIGAAINRVPTKTLTAMKMSGTMLTDFGDMIRLLEAGQSFLGDHASSRTVLVQIRPRVTSHGGYSPI
jgi:uncharacterized protein